jgi:hypothetical protein
MILHVVATTLTRTIASTQRIPSTVGRAAVRMGLRAHEGIRSGSVDGDALTANLSGGHAHGITVDSTAGVGVVGRAKLPFS